MRMGIKIYVLITFLSAVGTMAAGSMAPFQSQDVITNFFLNEDDTTRHTHHYLYEQAYQIIEDMLIGRHAISLKDAEFAIENAFLEGQTNRASYDYIIAAIANNVQRDAALLRPRMPSNATAKNLALTLFFSEDRESNNYQHYTYDMQSLFNDGGIVGGMHKIISKKNTNILSKSSLTRLMIVRTRPIVSI